ncbi:hypothetical protein [Candidatus Marimicrobium litorale]|uniref:Uncharacterized protein n=1 Tax=Candidatus Marimicrobium litorale TaxID=2518991 RepID=A0ABT3T3X4_9GAMM|nr:hypothetical protein [Candidatus Marimicrobium litorale]MCX2976975.1 hypothetical protein [Candidatus Marimicrobium litorale]
MMFSKYKVGALCAILLTGGAHASDTGSINKIKTGILPTGGFFSIYEAACPQNTAVSIASTDRRQRWCVQSDGQLRCFGAASEATRYACSGVLLADSTDDSGRVLTQ